LKPDKNILFISHDGMTDPLGQSQVIPYLQGISRSGPYHFYILSLEKKVAYEKNKQIIEQSLKGYNITWVPLTYHNKPAVFSTLYDNFKLKKAAANLHRQHQVHMVHTRSGMPALIGLWLKKKFGIKFLHDIREFYADGRIDGKMWNLKNPVYNIIYRYFKQKEKQEIQYCDGINCLTHAAERIIKKLPYYNSKTPLQVIPCSVDMQLFDPQKYGTASIAELKKGLGIQANEIVFSYLGSIGGYYLTEEMIRFCKLVAEKFPLAKFLFISPHRHEQILAVAAQYGLSTDKVITVNAKRAEVPQWLAISNYSFFFIKQAFSKLSSSPTKHAEIMAMGIPVITNNAVGDLEEIIRNTATGFVLKDFTNESFMKLIDQLAGENNFNKAAIRTEAEKYYALPKAIQKYTALYTAILEE
jgi:glycosyltransferase involved in cell wall biosynthesis